MLFKKAPLSKRLAKMAQKCDQLDIEAKEVIDRLTEMDGCNHKAIKYLDRATDGLYVAWMALQEAESECNKGA